MFATFFGGRTEGTFFCHQCRAWADEACIQQRHYVPPWLNANCSVIDLLMGRGDDEPNHKMSSELSVTEEKTLPERFVYMSIDPRGVNGPEHYVYTSDERPPSPAEKVVYTQLTSTCAPERYVYVAINPARGSAEGGHPFTLVSLSGPKTTILGAEEIVAMRTEDYETKMVAHLRAIRALSNYANATFVVGVEAGTGLDAPHIETTIRRQVAPVVFVGVDAPSHTYDSDEDDVRRNRSRSRLHDTIFMSDFDNKAGMLTSAYTKREMAELTHTLYESGDIAINVGLITSHSTPMDFMSQLADQFETPVPTEAFATLMQAIYYRKRFHTEPRYRAFIA